MRRARRETDHERTDGPVTAGGFYRRYETERSSDHSHRCHTAQKGDHEVPEFLASPARRQLSGADDGPQSALIVM